MNQRQIKFRAFIYGIGKMVDVMALNRSGSIYVSRIQIYGEEGEDILLQPETEGQKVFDLVEFTGLKDKNRKEIYEGDIVKCWGSLGGEKAEVIFDEYAQFIAKMENGGKTFLSATSNGEKIVEVIGSVYENPELLK